MKNSHIEWTDHTFNPWEGCTKVSPGCAHCYAEARNARFGGGTAPNWGKGAPRRRMSADYWKQPLRWNQEAVEAMSLASTSNPPARPRVFCASLADVFDAEVPDQWRADLLNLIDSTPHLDWLLLTKRPGEWREAMERIADEFYGHESTGPGVARQWLKGRPPSNVWMGTSVENLDELGDRHRLLMEIPAPVHFWSVEPMLSLLNVREAWAKYLRPDWVICGGESGHGARPMHPDWPQSLRDQCAAAGVAFFFKQWGEWYPGSADGKDFLLDDRHGVEDVEGPFEVYTFPPGLDGTYQEMARIGKKSAGRILAGVEHNAFPEVRS